MMSPEHKHQLYGGEIGDYMSPQKYIPTIDGGVDIRTAHDIEQIYNTQVKGKPSINTTGLISPNIKPPITRDTYYDQLGHELANTLSMISQQLDLTNNSHPTKHKTTALQPQNNDDIMTAQNNVINALKELKDLNAI